MTDARGRSTPRDLGTEPGIRSRWLLPATAVVMGIWALLPRYTGPDLSTTDRVEIADHVVPGGVVLAVAATVAILRLGRRGSNIEALGTLLFVAGLIVTLAGLWMTATHVPLLAQASRAEATWGAAAYHTAPGLAVLLLGAVWSWVHWSDAAPRRSGGS